MLKILKKCKDKLFCKDEFYNFAIQAQQRFNLQHTIDFILNFNEAIPLDLTGKYKNQKMSE